LSLPTEYQSYYVYEHIDPDSHEIVYIGMGKRHRAWVMGTMRNHKINNLQYGHRNKDHNNWMESLISEGYLPNDWVHIVCRSLDKGDAVELETGMIKDLKPIYNITHSERYHTPHLIDEAKALYIDGLSYSELGAALNVSTMKAWRLCNVYKK